MTAIGQKRKHNAFDTTINIIMLFVIFICLYPMWYVLCLSLTDNNIIPASEIWFLPKAITLDNYRAVFSNNDLSKAFYVTLKRTLIGTVMSTFLNAFVAYGLSKKNLIGRKFFLTLILITMYFGGGLIPWYITLKRIGLVNSFWGMVIPNLYAGFNIIIIKTFYSTIPESLEESAKLDGANDIYIFFKIILPLSLPVMFTIALFIAVYHWNDWFSGDLLIMDSSKIPLQTLLVRIIFQSQAIKLSMMQARLIYTPPPSSESVKMAAIIISTVPILIIYPFMQKFFVKGIMLALVYYDII
jgi:putative aldouronate transport system permease protein